METETTQKKATPKTTPRISLVVPNLNEETYLPTFIASLRRQTCQDFEVVFVDGVSTDASVEIIGNMAMDFLNVKLIGCNIRNIGLVRNIGAGFTTAPLIFETSSDLYFEPTLIERVIDFFDANPHVWALGGRTFPLSNSVVSHLAYGFFDLLRRILYPVKFRPAGNFTVVRRRVFKKVKGFPHVCINEDGLFAQRLEEFSKPRGGRLVFKTDFWVGHFPKRFETVGGVKSILFYLYVLGNMFPMLKPFLNHIENKSADTFRSRRDLEGKP